MCEIGKKEFKFLQFVLQYITLIDEPFMHNFYK